MPTGVAMLSEGRALVADEYAHSVAALDLALSKPAAIVTSNDWQAAPDNDPSEIVTDDERDGRRLFSTGLKGWSFLGQAWSSCESCHPEGLSDGVTWRFARGPRRSISLAGTYFGDDPKRRILLWGANIDEVHDVEAIARRVSGGVGGVVWKPYAEPTGKDCRLLYDGSTPMPAGDAPACSAAQPTTLRANGLNGSLASLTRAARGVLVLLLLLVTRDKREAGIQITVRDGDARVSGRCERGCDARDHLEGDSRCCERLAFFAPAAEHKGVSPFESHDALPRPALLDKQGVDVVLRHRVLGGLLADVDRFHVVTAVGQKLGVGEVVVDDDIGRCQ